MNKQLKATATCALTFVLFATIQFGAERRLQAQVTQQQKSAT